MEDGSGRGEGAKAVGRLVVDIGERQLVTTSEKGADVLEVNGGPADGFEEFGNADAAVVVAVDEGEGFLVEEGAFDRTGEGNPEFLIQLGQVDQVFGRGDDDLVEPAHANEIPDMGGGGRSRWAHRIGRSK